jgi:hypothetical protein
MSQFNQPNFGNFGPGSYDPVSNFSPFGQPIRRGSRNQGPSNMGPGSFDPATRLRQLQSQGQNASAQQTQRFSGGFNPKTTLGRSMVRQGQQGGMNMGVRDQVRANDAAWSTVLGGSIFQDMTNQQNVMNEQFARANQMMGGYGQAVQEGAQAIRAQDAQMRQNIGGLAQRAEQQGQAAFDEFKQFRDQQIGRVDQDISQANRFAQEATENYQQAIGEYQDRSAQQAADLRIGLERQVQNTMRTIEMGRNPDGSLMSPAERAAMQQTLQAETAMQVSQGVNQIYTGLNDTMAQMKGNLSSLMNVQSQTALAGGQLRGQMGTAFGAQTIDASRQRAAMTELSANLNTTMEQLSAASQLQSVNLLTNGYKDMYAMVQGNRRGVTSMFAALTGYIAAMTTPGMQFVPQPNFGGGS